MGRPSSAAPEAQQRSADPLPSPTFRSRPRIVALGRPFTPHPSARAPSVRLRQPQALPASHPLSLSPPHCSRSDSGPGAGRRAGPAPAVPARRQEQGLARPAAKRGPFRQSRKAVTCAPAPGRAWHGCEARRPLGRSPRLPSNPRQAEPVTRCTVGRLPGAKGASALAGPIFPGPRGG